MKDSQRDREREEQNEAEEREPGDPELGRGEDVSVVRGEQVMLGVKRVDNQAEEARKSEHESARRPTPLARSRVRPIAVGEVSARETSNVDSDQAGFGHELLLDRVVIDLHVEPRED